MTKVVSIATFAAGRMTDHKSLVPGLGAKKLHGRGGGTCGDKNFSNAEKSPRPIFARRVTDDLNSLEGTYLFHFHPCSFARE